LLTHGSSSSSNDVTKTATKPDNSALSRLICYVDKNGESARCAETCVTTNTSGAGARHAVKNVLPLMFRSYSLNTETTPVVGCNWPQPCTRHMSTLNPPVKRMFAGVIRAFQAAGQITCLLGPYPTKCFQPAKTFVKVVYEQCYRGLAFTWWSGLESDCGITTVHEAVTSFEAYLDSMHDSEDEARHYLARFIDLARCTLSFLIVLNDRTHTARN